LGFLKRGEEMIRGIQVLGILIGLFFLYQSNKLVKNKDEDVPEFLLWTIIGVVLITISAYPEAISSFLGIAGMTDQVYFLFTSGILLLYLVVMHLFKLNRELNKQISKLNEEMSILRYKKEKKK
jgi:hypothetical protein